MPVCVFVCLAALSYTSVAAPPAIPPGPPGIIVGGNVNSNTVTATGTTKSRTLSSRAADVINLADFTGVDPTGVSDSTSGINAAVAVFRSSLNSGKAAELFIPQGQFLISTSGGANFTNINSYDGTIVFSGGTFVCNVTTACVDDGGSEHITWKGLSISGTAAIAFQMFRQGVSGGGATACGNQVFQGGKISGTWSSTGILNGACETDQFSSLLVQNNSTATGCYAYIMDGENHFHWSSSYITVYTPQNSSSGISQGDNTHFGLTFVSSCNSPGIVWASGTQHTQFIGGYALGLGSTGPSAQFTMYDDGQNENSLFRVDEHTEGSTPFNYIFFQTGSNTTPKLQGLDYSDHASEASVAVFHADTGITGVTIDGNIRFEQTISAPPVMWDQPSLWTVSGSFTMPQSGYWVSPSSFSGMLCISGSCNSSTVFPSPLQVSALANAGGVASVNYSDQGHYRTGFSSVTATIGAPPSGGSQATVTFPLQQFGAYSITGGSGYSVNDNLSLLGGTCTTTSITKVLSVDGVGAVLTSTGNGDGVCTATPTYPLSFTGGTGTGASVTSSANDAAWRVDSAAQIITSGSGYLSSPSVSFNCTGYCTGAAIPVATTGLSSTITATAGAGVLTLNSSGATLSGSGSAAVSLDVNGNVTLGNGGLSGTASNGYAYMPTCSSDPSGTPTSKTGFAPRCYNPTNNKEWIYNGSAWKYVQAN